MFIWIKVTNTPPLISKFASVLSRELLGGRRLGGRPGRQGYHSNPAGQASAYTELQSLRLPMVGFFHRHFAMESVPHPLATCLCIYYFGNFPPLLRPHPCNTWLPRSCAEDAWILMWFHYDPVDRPIPGNVGLCLFELRSPTPPPW